MANTENVDPATKKIIRQVYICYYLTHLVDVAWLLGCLVAWLLGCLVAWFELVVFH